MTKFDSLNLTAPHTMRELEQSECETAAAMRAKKIAAMVEEDRWLDGDVRGAISNDAIILGLGYLNGTGCTLSFGGDGAKMAITPRARAALNELLAHGFAEPTDPVDQIIGREHYRGCKKEPHFGALAKAAGINPFSIDETFIAFSKIGGDACQLRQEKSGASGPRLMMPKSSRRQMTIEPYPVGR